jgi:murein DD-endopeptidase MepM/ murein hydrolase activator NlpD
MADGWIMHRSLDLAAAPLVTPWAHLVTKRLNSTAYRPSLPAPAQGQLMKTAANMLIAWLLANSPVAHAVQTDSLRPSFDLRVPDVPHAATTDAGTQVFEELHLTNFTETPLRLVRVDVMDAQDRHVLASFAGDSLQRRLARIGSADAPGDAVVPPGRRDVVYIEWPTHGRRPRAIEHAVAYVRQPGTRMDVVHGARTMVSYRAGAALGPPLRGGPWVAIHRAEWARGHRRVFNAVGGQARIPGRFAIDWIRVDGAGHTARRHPDRPGDWLGYGADVLAVADATVADVRGDMVESASVSGNPKHVLADDAGNFVALRLDDGRYVFYEHLRPGSIKVVLGQHVRRGEVLAELGFTGASTGPHLHLHVADGPSRIASEGRPFTLAAFDLLGSYGDLSRLGKASWTPRPAREAGRRLDEWPAENAVVRFPK